MCVGAIWARLLVNHAVPALGAVIEVGPGFQDKIGRGLAERHFGGTLYVVEPNSAARAWVSARYARLLPRATIVPIADALGEAIRQVPPYADAMLMNHVLDDLMLDAWLPRTEREAIFAGMRPRALEDAAEPDDAVIAARDRAPTHWHALLAHDHELRDIGVQVERDVVTAIDTLQPRIVGVSQYASWLQQSRGLAAVDASAAALLRRVARYVTPLRRADAALLRAHGQDPDRWLFGAPVDRSTMTGDAVPFVRAQVSFSEASNIRTSADNVSLFGIGQ